MTNIEETVRKIQKVHSALTGLSDNNIEMLYKGTSYGITFPWQARIDKHEVNAKSHDAALETLLDELRAALTKKINDSRRHAEHLEKTLKEAQL